MKKYLLALALPFVLFVSPAQAQCTGQALPGYMCGNSTASQANPTYNTITSMLDRGFTAAQGQMLNRGVSNWSSTYAPSLGLNGATGGSLTLNGSTSGSVTLKVNAAAGTATNFQFPNNNGTVNYVLVTDGSGNTSWVSNTSGGTVTSVGLSLPAIFTVSGSPVISSGTLTGTLATQSANSFFAGPTTGAASAPTFRNIVNADMPTPTTSALGGIQAINAVASNWIRSINTSGVAQLSQPAFSDISGAITPAQCPNPSASTIGCIQSFALQASKWISSISTSGVPAATQPNFTDIAGSVSPSQLPSVGNNSVLGNNSGGTAIPTGITASNVLDMIGATQGQVLYRGASGWSVLAPGTNGQVFTTAGAAANPSWTTVTGTGTVTSIATNNGITGGPVTTTGTIGLATIATGNALAYTGAGSGVPVATTPSVLLDVIGSTQGNILYRGVSTWQVLAPGTNGQVLTQGASTPTWASAGSVSNVTISAGTGIGTSGTCNITTTGTCTVNNAGVTSVASQTGALTIAATNPLTNAGTVLSVTQATKSDQQTGTSNAVAVTPLHQQDHDSAAKVVLMFTGSGSNGAQTINFNYNVVASTRTAVGVYSIALVNAFASTSYACVGASNGGTTDGAVEFISQTASSIVAVFKTFASGATFDPVNGAYIVCYGRQ